MIMVPYQRPTLGSHLRLSPQGPTLGSHLRVPFEDPGSRVPLFRYANDHCNSKFSGNIHFEKGSLPEFFNISENLKVQRSFHRILGLRVQRSFEGLCLPFKCEASACDFTKSSTPQQVFCTFLNCINGTKSRKASHMNDCLPPHYHDNIYYEKQKK